MKSLKGKLLLASAHMVDPNFAKSVILLFKHDEEGAVGLILNRRLEATIRQACEDSLDLPAGIDGPLFHGGPCPGPLMPSAP